MKIALMGYARSGKDSVAAIIAQRLPRVCPMAFGDQLKTMFHGSFINIPVNPKPREGYEKFGKLMREIDEDIWVRELEDQYKYLELLHSPRNYVITDLRQPNEAEWCRKNGFVIVRVNSHVFNREDRSTGDSVFHPINESEQHIWMIDHDYSIFNDGTVQELEQEVDTLLSRMGAVRR